ncbi:MAG: hypothetical protein ACRD8Z_04605 [Nitrososphaeraceae archaeon]
MSVQIPQGPLRGTKRGTEFYSIINGVLASMIKLFFSINKAIGASFGVAFDDDKITNILGLPVHFKAIGIIALARKI